MVFGYDSNGNYFVKNSWGANWGVNGYGTVSGNMDCGVTSQVLQYANRNFRNALIYGNCSVYNPPDNDKSAKWEGVVGKGVGVMVMVLVMVML